MINFEIEQLKSDRVEDFFNYCRKHRGKIVSGNIQEQDLLQFKLVDNPTYIAVNKENHIVGAISLKLDDYSREIKEGRIRIFHCETNEEEIFKLMFNKIRNHTKDLNSLIVFIMEDDEITDEILKSIGFVNDGYSFTMIREDKEVGEIKFPEGFELRTFRIGYDEKDWCIIRNIGFGDEGLMTPDMVHIFYDDEAYIDSGMRILYHMDKPVGTIRTTMEYEDDVPYAYIASVCVKQEYRGMGLAKGMLKAAIQFGRSKKLHKALLEVDVKNKSALTLYTGEGFEKAYGMAIYKYYL